MNIFDLFDNSTANELLALLPKDKLSNVGNNVVVNKLDFTKKEDLDKLVEAVDTFKKADSGLLGMVKTLVGDSFDTTLDNVVKAAQQEYAKAHKDDTVKANKSYISGNTDLTEYKKQRTKLLNQLAVLIGETPNNSESLTRINYDNLHFSGNLPSEIPTDVIMQRPDYLKSEKMLEKAGIDVKVARKEFLPTFNIGAFAMFLSNDLGSLWSTKNALAGLGGGLGLPLFTGGRRIANLKLKKDEYERLLNNYYKTN